MDAGVVWFSIIVIIAGYYVWSGYNSVNKTDAITDKFKNKGFNIYKSRIVPKAFFTTILAVDKSHNQIGFGYYTKGKAVTQIYNAQDIISCEVLEDEDSIIKTSSSSILGRSIVGGVLTGGVGAIIGGVTAGKTTKQIVNSVKLRIVTSNLDSPINDFTFLNVSTKKASSSYVSAIHEATEWYGITKALMHSEK